MNPTPEDILKRGYFECHICGESHMALIPFEILGNGEVICACHTTTLNSNLLEAKRQLEASIFTLVKWFEVDYGASVKSVNLQQSGLGVECTGTEVVVVI